MIPDLLLAFLTGEVVQEYTNATTTQCVAVDRGEWDVDLLHALGIPTHLFGPLTAAPIPVGALTKAVQAETGLGPIPASVVASHDTASAVAAVPAPGRFAFLSCGTWSLLGTETITPVLSDAARDANLSNEGGVLGTFRLLRNIMGLWLIESCRREWGGGGTPVSHGALSRMASVAPPLRSLIDPDHHSFLNPDSMVAAVGERCRVTGEPEPVGPGALARCLYESLALKYRFVLERLEAVVGERFDGLHVVGGGARNELLCQYAADAIGRPVFAGPVEATAIGNVGLQAIATGELTGLGDLRETVRESFPVTTYLPHRAPAWDEAWGRFRELVGRQDDQHGGRDARTKPRQSPG
jgi:rhamnulokinase